jgi:hypothetical protein
MNRPIAAAGPATALVVLSLCLPAWGQGIGDVALREKQRRARAASTSPSVPTPPSVLTLPTVPTETTVPTEIIKDEALRRGSAQPSPEAESAPAVAASPASGGVSLAALLRHLASAEAYLKRCEGDLAQARERWLSASQANEPRAGEEARRAIEAATRQLERARVYRDEAETAARRAGVQPFTP